MARTLVEYEIMWHASWLRGVDAACSGLDTTLICQDPHTGRPSQQTSET